MPSQSFEENYFAETYGGNYLKRNPEYKWRAFLKHILAYKNEGKLMDVGCAMGLFLKEATPYFDCTGCDISDYALKQARRYVPDNVFLFQGVLGNININNTFDVVTCFDVLEHIPNLDESWKNLKELLKTGGVLVLTVPVYDGPLGRLVYRLDKDSSHIHRRERKFWLEQLNSHFELVAYLGVWRFFLFNRFYINLVSSHTRQWTTAILLIARKY